MAGCETAPAPGQREPAGGLELEWADSSVSAESCQWADVREMVTWHSRDSSDESQVHQHGIQEEDPLPVQGRAELRPGGGGGCVVHEREAL